MSHPEINNNTPFVLMPLFASDEDGRPLLAPLIKATYKILQDSNSVQLNEEQVEPNPGGEFWFEDERCSYKYEPETAFFKPSSDVVLVGHACAPNGQTAQIDVGLKIGPVQKAVRVIGDRYWVKQNGRTFATKPKPFEKMPLIYERAFGGWDKADNDENNWRFDGRNPLGVGFGDPFRFVEEGKLPMPNLEDPQHLIRNYGDLPPPTGFGFNSPNWQSRVQYAGTYDDEWDRSRKPLLPKDFDRRFFNAAPIGLITPNYLRGDEDVLIINASPVPKLKFKLPCIPPPKCNIELRDGRTEVLQTNLDTVIIDTDEMLVFLMWRNYMNVPSGPNDVMSIEVTTERGADAAAMA